jgi:hypothetical protein
VSRERKAWEVAATENREQSQPTRHRGDPICEAKNGLPEARTSAMSKFRAWLASLGVLARSGASSIAEHAYGRVWVEGSCGETVANQWKEPRATRLVGYTADILVGYTSTGTRLG